MENKMLSVMPENHHGDDCDDHPHDDRHDHHVDDDHVIIDHVIEMIDDMMMTSST